MILVFGVISQDNIALRGVRCALRIHRSGLAQGGNVCIGVTTGRVFTGTIGHAMRRDYVVLGDAVNTAARIMELIYKDGKKRSSSTGGVARTAVYMFWRCF